MRHYPFDTALSVVKPTLFYHSIRIQIPVRKHRNLALQAVKMLNRYTVIRFHTHT